MNYLGASSRGINETMIKPMQQLNHSKESNIPKDRGLWNSSKRVVTLTDRVTPEQAHGILISKSKDL